MKMLLLVVLMVGCASIEELEREAYACNEELGVLAIRVQVNECMTKAGETRWSCMEQFPEPNNDHCIAKLNSRYDALANIIEEREEKRLVDEYCASQNLISLCNVWGRSDRTCSCISDRELRRIKNAFSRY